jgi:diguanylate cyclase (GGDEF)-like protein
MAVYNAAFPEACVSQLQASVREVAVLQQATQMILSSLDGDTVLHHVLLVVRNYFGGSRCAVYLTDGNTNELRARAQMGYDRDLSETPLPIGKESIAGWAAFTRAPLYIPDVSKETRHRMEHQGVASVLALPLMVRERVIGVLEIASGNTDPFSTDSIGLLSVFSGQAAIALENARLYSNDLRRMRQIEIINLIARTAAAANDTQQFYTMLADLVSDTFEGTTVAIVLSPQEGHLSIAAWAGGTDVEIQRFHASRQRGLLAEAFQKRVLVIDNDVAQSARPSCFSNSGSELCAPLVSLGEVLGAIVLGHTQTSFFTADNRSIAQAAADVCSTAARNVQLSEELRRLTNLDPLTGIYNQRYFHNAVGQEIQRSRRNKKEFGIVMLDLRSFRAINSKLGLEAGDEILRQVAASLRRVVRNNDVIARYMADRFALFLPELTGDGLQVVVTKLQQSVRCIQAGPAELSAHWATVRYPQDGSTEMELVKVLTTRLEAAKQQSTGASGTA